MIIRENYNGTETIVEEYNNSVIAKANLAKLQKNDPDNYYYLETR